MRRSIVLLVCALLFVGFVSCGGDGNAKDSSDGVQASSNDDKAPNKDDSDSSTTTADDEHDKSTSAAVAAFTSQDCVQALQAISAAYGAAGLAMAGQTDAIDKSEKDLA